MVCFGGEFIPRRLFGALYLSDKNCFFTLYVWSKLFLNHDIVLWQGTP